MNTRSRFSYSRGRTAPPAAKTASAAHLINQPTEKARYDAGADDAVGANALAEAIPPGEIQ